MNICGGPNGISVFNNDHSLGTLTMKRVYWQPRGMPLFTHSDGEHVMQPVKESWENFDPKEFEETVCAGGANGVSSHAPEHMLGNSVQTFSRGIDSDKPDEENLADKPPVTKTIVMESWADYKPEAVLNEQDQQAAQPQQQVQAQPQPAAQPQQNVAAQAPQQAVASNQVQQPAQQVAQPQAQPQPQAVAQQQASQQISTTPTAQAPQSQIVNNHQQVQESWEGVTADYIRESLALPGGMLNAEPTEYEKELDKHNQARKNNKIDNPESIGDPNCGEIGVHDYKDSGAPTGVKTKVTTDIKATELKPNKNAVEVNPKKKWDD